VVPLAAMAALISFSSVQVGMLCRSSVDRE
jgi:hypothetical protein